MSSKLERQFALHWRAIGGMELVPEFRFHDMRRWRFDFAHTVAKVAIELEGGIWTGGRHTRGSGFAKDCEKYNDAQLKGWDVFRLTSDQLHSDLLERINEHIRTRAIANADPYQCQEPYLPTSLRTNKTRKPGSCFPTSDGATTRDASGTICVKPAGTTNPSK